MSLELMLKFSNSVAHMAGYTLAPMQSKIRIKNYANSGNF
jgi:hypothetical protein